MRPRLAVTVLALLLPAAPARAAEPIGECRIPDSATVEAVGGRLVVWSTSFADRYGDVTTRHVACRRSTGSRVRVIETYDDGIDRFTATRFAVAGDRVAYADEFLDHYGTQFLSIAVFDARRRRVVRRVEVGVDRPFAEPLRASIDVLVVTRAGGIAYVKRRSSDRDENGRVVERVALRATDTAGSRLLDKGEGIDPASVRLSGSTLTWTNAGDSRSATLH
jgi:hypothetical protein